MYAVYVLLQGTIGASGPPGNPGTDGIPGAQGRPGKMVLTSLLLEEKPVSVFSVSNFVRCRV